MARLRFTHKTERIKCNRCGGSGRYKQFGRCFGCDGTGYRLMITSYNNVGGERHPCGVKVIAPSQSQAWRVEQFVKKFDQIEEDMIQDMLSQKGGEGDETGPLEDPVDSVDH